MLCLTVCEVCGAKYFPARLRCHQCGGTLFQQQSLADARVTGVTQVHRIPEGCEFGYLVELLADGGPHILAGAVHAPQVGANVCLAQRDDGAVFIPQN